MQKIHHKVSPASSCFAGKPLELALKELGKQKSPVDECIPKWDLSKTQLCPQHVGYLSADIAQRMKENNPNIHFRLHANVKLQSQLIQFDASNTVEEMMPYLQKMKEIQQIVDAKYYSYHAPMHNNLSWNQVAQNVKELQDFLQIPVALEGLYPGRQKTNDLWTDSAHAYESILTQNIYYALDLSHLNIAYQQSDEKTKEKLLHLTAQMLDNPLCLEVHVSGNDGSYDEHTPIRHQEPWWLSLLNSVELNAQCVVFCESIQAKKTAYMN